MFVTVPIVLDVTRALKVQDPRVAPLAAGTVADPRENDVAPGIAVTRPPAQVVAGLAGLATVTPAGRLSVRAAPVRGEALPFVIVIVSVDALPDGSEAGAKALERAAPVCTTRFPEIAFAFDTPWVVVIAPIGRVFVAVPFVVDVTLTRTLQLPAAGIVAPETEKDPAPALAVTTAPAHVVVTDGGFATVIDAGNVSVNEAPVSGVALELFSWTVRVEGPPDAIGDGENDFDPVGAATAATESVALAGVPFVVPSAVVSELAGIVLMWFPGVIDVTSIWKVQVPGVDPTCSGIVADAIATEFAPAVAVTVAPAHVVEAFGVGATTTFGGRLSVTAPLVSGA